MEGTTTDALPTRPDAISSDSVRERFHAVDGLRALAVLALTFYELLRAFPTIVPAHAFAAALQSAHAFDVLALLAGFSLAYPAFAVARQDGRAAFPLGRFALSRILRVGPAYVVVAALTVLVPVLAARIGFDQLAGPTRAFPTFADVLAALGTSAHVPLENDALWGVGAIARCYVLLPLLVLVTLRFPLGSALVALAAATAALMSPAAHAFGAGAAAAFALGVIAADLRAQSSALQRFGPLLAVLAAVGAAFGEATFARFPGSVDPAAPVGLAENPLWQLAVFGVLIAAARYAALERTFGITLFAFLSAASYGIALAAEPVVRFMIRATAGSLSAPIAALNAYLIALAAGIGLWAAVDRWFLDGPLRRIVVERASGLLDALLRPLRLDRVMLRDGRPGHADGGLGGDAPLQTGFYAPPPRPEGNDLAEVKRRIGSADDLAADIMATKQRLAERSAALFAEPEPEKPKPVYKKPGFHGPGFDKALEAAPTAGAATPPRPVLAAATEPPAAPAAPPAPPAPKRFVIGRGTESSAPEPIPPPSTEPTVVAESHAPPEPLAAMPASHQTEPHQAEPLETETTATEPVRGESAAAPAEFALPELDIDATLHERPPLDAQRFMAALDTLPTGDGSFDSSAAREFTDATLGDMPVSLDLPTQPAAEERAHADDDDGEVTPDEHSEPPTQKPVGRVKLTLRPDRPINVRVTPDTPNETGRNGHVAPQSFDV